MKRILYITRNGLLEPLGQSQVMAYIRGLSNYYDITLITFEKPEYWNDMEAMERAKKECSKLGIYWLPKLFQSSQNIISHIFSLFWMIWYVRRQIIQRKISLIHARSYIPAAVALAVKKITKVVKKVIITKLIFFLSIKTM